MPKQIVKWVADGSDREFSTHAEAVEFEKAQGLAEFLEKHFNVYQDRAFLALAQSLLRHYIISKKDPR